MEKFCLSSIRQLITYSVLIFVFLFYIGACSEPAGSVPNTRLSRDNPDLEFERQADRPPTVKTLFAMADILATQGKDADCEFVLRRIIQQSPKFLPAYNSLAELQMRQRRINEAMETISNGLRISSTDPVLLNNLGMCFVVSKKYPQALEMFTKAAGIRPENSRYRSNMAMVLGLMSRDEEALALFGQILPQNQANHNLKVLHGARDKAQSTQTQQFEIFDVEEAKESKAQVLN